MPVETCKLSRGAGDTVKSYSVDKVVPLILLGPSLFKRKMAFALNKGTVHFPSKLFG